MTILAWLVLFLFWMFAIGPALFSGSNPSYLRDVKTTLLVTCLLAGFTAILIAVVWAVHQVTQ